MPSKKGKERASRLHTGAVERQIKPGKRSDWKRDGERAVCLPKGPCSLGVGEDSMTQVLSLFLRAESFCPIDILLLLLKMCFLSLILRTYEAKESLSCKSSFSLVREETVIYRTEENIF